MIGKLLSVMAVATVLAGIYLLALSLARSARLSPAGADGGGTADIGGPQIVLRGVELIEAGREGVVYRLHSDDATYAALSGQVDASGVTLALSEPEGNIVVTAPAASWSMNEGRIDLADGASARNDAGWTATARRARVDLQSAVISADAASLTGPGVTVEGNNLRWSWDEGTITLESPKSTILPRDVTAPGKKG